MFIESDRGLEQVSDNSAAQMLVTKLGWYRKILPEPRPDSVDGSTRHMYISLSTFDPRELVAGNGYTKRRTTYAELALEILGNSRHMYEEDFFRYMNQNEPNNPLVTFNSEPAMCSKEGVILEAEVPTSLLIDPKRDERKKSLHLFGPLHPSWITNATSFAYLRDKTEDRSGVFALMRSRSSLEYFGHTFDQPISNLLGQKMPKEELDALKLAILVDGLPNTRQTHIPDVFPLMKANTFSQIKKCLGVIAIKHESMGWYLAQTSLEQVENYLVGKSGIEAIEDPLVQQAVINVGLQLVKDGQRY